MININIGATISAKNSHFNRNAKKLNNYLSLLFVYRSVPELLVIFNRKVIVGVPAPW